MSSNKPIVVGVDESKSAESAVRWAAEDAARHRVPLQLVHSFPTIEMYEPPTSFPPVAFTMARREAVDLLNNAAKLAEESAAELGGVDVSIEILDGPAIETLIKRSADSRLIVVGSRGMGAVGRALLGSVSTELTKRAHCPVAVIHARPEHHGENPPDRVVVGVDGTRNSVPAIAIAFDEASSRNLDLVAVHARFESSDGTPFGIDSPDFEVAAEAVLAESLAGWAERYPDVSVRRLAVATDPVRKILEQATRADLVVVGDHGRGKLARMLLGSTSQAVLHGVTCPIIVAHDPR